MTDPSRRGLGGGPDPRSAVQIRGLTKLYGATTAVRSLDLDIHRGEVYGLLGPNGAGKTTILRVLLGLIRPTAGTVRVFGREPVSPRGLSRVGALVESPAFYPYLSGRDNLRVMMRHSRASPARVDEVLGEVGLTARAKDRYKKYSLGMKQRLGVAAALLKDPLLLILDEPTNGLDPKGMADVRALIRRLRAEGKTVILSSHLMGEVEQLCDRVGVLQGGRLVAESSVEDLRDRTGLLVRAEPLKEASIIAARLRGVEGARVEDGWLRLAADSSLAAEINRKLVSAGLDVSELRLTEQTLEQAFLALTEGGDA